MKELIMLVMLLTVATFADTNLVTAPPPIPIPGVASTNGPTPPISSPPYWTIDMMDPVEVNYVKGLVRKDIREELRPKVILQKKEYLASSADPWETIGTWDPYALQSFYRVRILTEGEVIPLTNSVTITKEGFEIGYLKGARAALEWFESGGTNSPAELIESGEAWTNYVNKIIGEE